MTMATTTLPPNEDDPSWGFLILIVIGVATLLYYCVWRKEESNEPTAVSAAEVREKRDLALRRLEQQQQQQQQQQQSSPKGQSRQKPRKEESKSDDNVKPSKSDEDVRKPTSSTNKNLRQRKNKNRKSVREVRREMVAGAASARQERLSVLSTSVDADSALERQQVPLEQEPFSSSDLAAAASREDVTASSSPRQRDISSPLVSSAPEEDTESKVGGVEEDLITPTDNKMSKQNKKKAAVVVPPAQLLCEALSVVTANYVSVLPGPGTWGGQQWKKRRWNTTTKVSKDDDEPVILLPLIQYYPNESDNNDKTEEDDYDWMQLQAAFQSILKGNDSLFLFCTKTVRRAAECHVRTRTVVRDLDSISFEDKQGLQVCMDSFAAHIASRCGHDIYTSAMLLDIKENDEDEDDFMPDGLFENEELAIEETSGMQNKSAAAASDDKFSELLELLSGTSSVITKSFVSDMLNGIGTDNLKLAHMLLDRALCMLPNKMKDCPRAIATSTIYSPMNLMTNLVNLSPDMIVSVLLSKLESEQQEALSDIQEGSKTPRQVENTFSLVPLLALCAYTVPDAGVERAITGRQHLSHFQHCLRSLGSGSYPTSVFSGPTRSSGLDKVLEEARRNMRASRAASTVVLKRIMMSGSKGKQWLFRWVGSVVRANDSFAHLLESDLLDPSSSAQQRYFSRQFMLGTLSAILDLCGQSLCDRFQKMGALAFEPLYLTHPCRDSKDNPSGGMLGIAEDERRLFSSSRGSAQATTQSSESSSISNEARFSGSTEFFFLIGAMLRVSLFPSLRIQQEFLKRHGDLFAKMREITSKTGEQPRLPDAFLDQVRRSTDVLLGWSTFLEDPSFVTTITNFSLLQLQWLVALSQNDKGSPQNNKGSPAGLDAFTVIPEWLCKLPAQWLARVALRHPHLMKPHQADEAVEYATRLLQVSSSSVAGSSFSPPVLTELIRIAGAFVQSGVQRAKQKLKIKEKRRNRRGMRNQSPGDDAHDEEIDERWLEIYLSFDANDLGVTVFANKYMLNNLCPTLIRTFSALDAVEGMDVEREHNFDKFGVKYEVAELLLRLWCHPGGEARASIVSLDEETISTFASSVAAAIGMALDNSLQMIIDIRGILKNGVEGPPTNQRYYDAVVKRIAGGIQQARRHLLLLCQLSEEDRIASVLGKSDFSACTDLANMFVQFLGKLTAEDGGTNPELDFRRSGTPTSKLIQGGGDITKEVAALLSARHFVSSQLGFDVSLLMHQFIALVTRWHVAAAKEMKEGQRGSGLLKAIARNEDFTLAQLQAVFGRLVAAREAQDIQELLHRDGHVDFDTWKDRCEFKTSAPIRDRSQRYFIKQDQMTHSQMDGIASESNIRSFVDDLQKEGESVHPKEARVVSEEEFQSLERALLNHSGYLETDHYSECLSEWIVSSQSFLSSSDKGRFAHTYDAVARSRSSTSIGSGKIMIKEARKCQRGIPAPHPNASTFVCFAEERMDLCRAIIVGAVDTPYSLGLYEFDVFFPAMYPAVPPLVTFKTTGGGQVRVNPNLYNDGKVCISLLGTANAWNESQRWNAETSSLAQVLLSIQSQILAVPDPFFNEGFGHEPLKGTQAGEEGSRRYNNSLRLATLRYAVIAYLKHPPQGFEEVTRRHFSLCRKRLLVQARRWMLEAAGTSLHKRFVRAYKELVVLLSEEVLRKESELVLPPLEEDVQALRRLDPVFADDFVEQIQNDKKPAARTEQDNASEQAFENPWANMDTLLAQRQGGEGNADEALDDDDDFYS